MKYKLFILAIVTTFIFSSCCNNTCSKDDSKEEQTIEEKSNKIDINKFQEQAADFVGKEIVITGTVVHICKHGAKRMHIIGDNPEKRVLINAGEEMKPFDIELEGTDVSVSGIIKEKKIDEDFLVNWEEQFTVDEDTTASDHNTGVHIHGEEGDDGLQNCASELQQIKDFRDKMKETGKDHVSIYSVDCTELKKL